MPNEEKDPHRAGHYHRDLLLRKRLHHLYDRFLHVASRRHDHAPSGGNIAGALSDPDQAGTSRPVAESHASPEEFRHIRKRHPQHGKNNQHLLRLPSQQGNREQYQYLEHLVRMAKISARQKLQQAGAGE